MNIINTAMNKKKAIRENLIKNVLIAIALIFFGGQIQAYIQSSEFLNIDSVGSVLTAVSMISVLAAFGNFGFEYTKLDLKIPFYRYFAHIVTGILLFVIGVSLIMAWQLLAFIMGPHILMEITLLLLYIACVGYDHWDLNAALR